MRPFKTFRVSKNKINRPKGINIVKPYYISVTTHINNTNKINFFIAEIEGQGRQGHC